MAKEQEFTRQSFSDFQLITTRWMDNDVYGHVNNVTYYSWFDTAVNRFMIEAGGLDIHNAPVIAYVVSSSCNYFRPIAYPENVEVGIRIDRLGKSSVSYCVGIFREGDEAICAQGEFIHVFVDRKTEKSCPIPDEIRSALSKLVVQDNQAS